MAERQEVRRPRRRSVRTSRLRRSRRRTPVLDSATLIAALSAAAALCGEGRKTR